MVKNSRQKGSNKYFTKFLQLNIHQTILLYLNFWYLLEISKNINLGFNFMIDEKKV